jgi:hypothetical protein
MTPAASRKLARSLEARSKERMAQRARHCVAEGDRGQAREI